MVAMMAEKPQSDPKKLGQTHSELISMPEFKLRAQIESINIPIYIFDQNYAELKTLLDFFIDNPKSIPLTFQRNRDKLDKVQLDILRRLHNFVEASVTLINHTRNYYNDLYGGSDSFPDYQSKVKTEFENDPLSQFIKGLRQYCQHYYSPNIVVEETFFRNLDGSDAIKKSVVLFKEKLMEFDGWNATAKKYLEKYAKSIDVLEFVEAYRNKVIEFYTWFLERQKEIHKTELALIQEKTTEYLQQLIESFVDSTLKQKDPKATIEEQVFAGVISSDEIVELEAFNAPPEFKADFAIILLSRHFPVPDMLRQKIISLYRR
jgi:hypothetical protein